MSESLNISAVNDAVAAARAALESWAQMPVARRIVYLEAFAEQLRQNKATLLEIISDETGKPRWESATEVDAMIGKVALSIRANDERRRPVETTNAGDAECHPAGGTDAGDRKRPSIEDQPDRFRTRLRWA